MKCIKVFFRYSKSYSVTAMLTVSLVDEVIFNVRFMHVGHCTTFCMSAFDVTDAFTFLLFSVLLFYGLTPEIKMD